MSETQTTYDYYPLRAREETVLPSHCMPKEVWDYGSHRGMYEVVRNSDMTYVRSQLLPEIMTTRSTVSPVESWLRDSWKSEFSSLDEAELEIDAGAAGVAYRDITIFIVDRIMAPQSSSLSVDEIELLFDNEL